MPLSTEQIAEMNVQVRKESQAGRPEVAARYRAALKRGEPYEAPGTAPKVDVSIPYENGPGSKKELWAAYAKANSDLDEEIIEAATKTDLIAMLKANGVIPVTRNEAGTE